MQNGVNMFMRLIFRPPFLFIGATIFSFTIDRNVGIVFVVTLIICASVIFDIMRRTKEEYPLVQESLDQMTLISNDALSGIRPVKAFNKEEYEKDRFYESVGTYRKRSMSLAAINAWFNPLTFFFINGALIFIVMISKPAASSDDGITTGQIVSLVSYLVACLAAMVMFSKMILSINKARASKERIDSLLAIEGDIKNSGVITKDEEASGTKLIEFKDVSLTYGKEGDKPAVSGLSFRIDKGETIGIIGGTGSGKSTAISLLLRLFEPRHPYPRI